jgi:hypothetical protein
MAGKLIKIKSDGNDVALKKLLNDLDIAETINQKQVEQNEKWTPERWYQELKKRWYFHGSSWYMRWALLKRQLTEEEMKIGCNGYNGCIPECRFYPPEGRVEEDELQRSIQSLTEYLEHEKKSCPVCSKEQHEHEDNNNKNEGRAENKE